MRRLENKVAIVFGAGSVGPGWGNGKATATLFAREGATVVREFSPEAGPEVTEGGHHLGVITSGGPSPSLGGGVAMAYLPYDHREPGTKVQVVVRGRPQTAEVVPMPFHPHRYHRKAKV